MRSRALVGWSRKGPSQAGRSVPRHPHCASETQGHTQQGTNPVDIVIVTVRHLWEPRVSREDGLKHFGLSSTKRPLAHGGPGLEPPPVAPCSVEDGNSLRRRKFLGPRTYNFLHKTKEKC